MGSICNGYMCIVLYIYGTYVVYWFSRDLFSIGGVGSICNGYMCIVLYIYGTYVVYWFSRDLCLIGGGDGVSLQWVYVYCAISAKFDVMVFKTSMLN